MNTYLSHLSQAQQQRINHVFHNVTQADPSMRITGLRYYAPQLDAVEKGVLYNIMRDRWPHLTDEERRIYVQLAADAEYKLNGRGVGNTAVDPPSEMVIALRHIHQYIQKQATNAAESKNGNVLFDLDMPSDTLGFTGLEDSTPPQKSLKISVEHEVPSAYTAQWKMATDFAAKSGMPNFLLRAGSARVNATDFKRVRGLWASLQDAFTLIYRANGGEQEIRIKINVDSQWYDPASTQLSEWLNLALISIENAKKETEKKSESNTTDWLRWGVIVGVNVATIAGIVWLVKRLVRRDMAQMSGPSPQMPRRLT